MGQLSDDRQWWWDGGRWTPACLSPDNQWHWDGTAWQRVDHKRPAHALRGELGVSQARLELDPPRFGAGEMPAHLETLPGKASVQLGFVAIGWGWVARRVVRWHLMPIPEIQAVAVVPPLLWDGEEVVASRPGPLPDLALRDFFGRCLRIEASQLTSPARKELLSQVPMAAHMTPIATTFLEEGTLPGKWGQRLASFGPRASG
jgi:hypothetical protein